MRRGICAVLFASACLFGMNLQPARAASGDTIGGAVKSAAGPEAGVWVIAETDDLPTKFVKIVVTDDQGRYLLPELPKAKYRIWVRGYGLVDSQPVEGMPGRTLSLTAMVAPDGRAAAQVYPAEFWMSMIRIPQGDIPPDRMAFAIKDCA